MGNSVKGRDFLMSISIDAGVTFLPFAGIKTREFTRENPVADETNQASTGNETESMYTGYSTVTMSGSGTSDTREAGLYPLKDLVALANNQVPEALVKLENVSLGTFEGLFTITSFGLTTEQNGLVEFSIAMQNTSAITFTPAAAT